MVPFAMANAGATLTGGGEFVRGFLLGSLLLDFFKPLFGCFSTFTKYFLHSIHNKPSFEY
jgi:hypothetical protein